jgi:hypothetical protein
LLLRSSTLHRTNCVTFVCAVQLTLDYFLSLEGGCSATQLLDAHLRGQNPQTAGDYRKVTADEVRNAAAAALKTTPAYAVLGATAGTPSLAAISKML